MKRYLLPCLLFLAGNEILSLLALLVITWMFLGDIASAKMQRDAGGGA